MTGKLDVLSVGLGDLKLTFNKHDATETARARRAVETMLKQGYAILVENPDHTYSRVQAFDSNTDCYILNEEDTAAVPANVGGKKRVPAAGAKAVAVARSAGG